MFVNVGFDLWLYAFVHIFVHFFLFSSVLSLIRITYLIIPFNTTSYMIYNWIFFLVSVIVAMTFKL